MISAPKARNSASMSAHGTDPLTGLLKISSRVARCFRFIPLWYQKTVLLPRLSKREIPTCNALDGCESGTGAAPSALSYCLTAPSPSETELTYCSTARFSDFGTVEG